jgi:putative transposase
MIDDKLTPWDDAKTPALAIVARGDQITAITATSFTVRSQSRPEQSYTVQVHRDRWECDCTFFTETRQNCIHILSVKVRNGFIAPEAEDKPKCANCRSSDIIRYGRRYNKSGTIDRYLCKTCGRRFTGKEGFQGRRSDPEKIALALDLYFRGMSLRQIAEHFHQVFSLKISHQTIYRWIVHYSKLAADWMDSQGAEVGERWHMDETVININGVNHYLWNIMDAETRFLLATHVSRGRSHNDTRASMKKAKKTTESRPTELFTDHMPSYPWAVRKEFGFNARKFDKLSPGFHSPHRAVPSIRAAESNNIVERLHGTEKSRTKVMRAFDQVKGAASLMDGWRVHYDMVRDHQSLGMTPAEAAGIAKIEGFRWLELIKLAATTRNVTTAQEIQNHPTT